LKFNFSKINPEIDKVEDSFDAYIRNCWFLFGKKYRSWLDDDYFAMIESNKDVLSQLEFALNYIGYEGLKVYVLIDEYDNFTNTILAAVGQSHYQKLTHGTGFFRFFFRNVHEIIRATKSACPDNTR